MIPTTRTGTALLGAAIVLAIVLGVYFSGYGNCCYVVMKRVRFVPLVTADRAAPGAAITLVNSTALNLLGKKNRAIGGVAFGMYQCDGRDTWTEIYFATQGAALVNELEDRIADLESKLAAMER
jgi:hypothetical protein